MNSCTAHKKLKGCKSQLSGYHFHSKMSLVKDLGPVVQSIVSLTKSLVSDSLSLLVRLKSSVLIFFAEKMWGAFAKAPHIFSAKNGTVFMYDMFKILTSR